VISHIVLFEPKADATDADKREFIATLEDLCRRAPEVRRAHVGRRINIGAGYEDKGGRTYAYAAVIEFDDEAALKAYLAHPRHQDLSRLFWTLCEATSVIDVAMTEATSADVVDLLSVDVRPAR
jgi:hypothetical protein